MHSALVIAIILLSAPMAFGASRATISFGSGDVNQTFGTIEDDFSTYGAFLEAHYDWNNILIGLNYSVSGNISFDGDGKVDSIFSYGPYLGLSLFNRLEIMAGYGWGRSKQDVNIPESLTQHDGHGPFYGVRLHLFGISRVAIGLSAHYAVLKDDHYERSTNGGTLNKFNQDAESDLLTYGLTVSFQGVTLKN